MATRRERRISHIEASIRKLVIDGYMEKEFLADSLDGLKSASDREIVNMFRLHVNECLAYDNYPIGRTPGGYS